VYSPVLHFTGVICQFREVDGNTNIKQHDSFSKQKVMTVASVDDDKSTTQSIPFRHTAEVLPTYAPLPPPVAPHHETTFSEVQRRPSPLPIYEDDLALAQMIQEEELKAAGLSNNESFSSRASPAPSFSSRASPAPSFKSRASPEPSFSSHASPAQIDTQNSNDSSWWFTNRITPIEEDDEEFAKRLQQEERDEHMAMQLQASEEQRMARAHMTDENNIAPGQRKCSPCTRKKLCSAFMMLCIVGGGVVLVLFYGPNIWSKVSGGDPFFRDNWDPGDGNYTVGGFSRWHGREDGLELTLINALTSDWHKIFDKAVSDWNECPALDLSVQTSSPEKTCSAVDGEMKVCNDFYGFTQWTGLNEVYFEGDGKYIISSVAKMNESYLKEASREERQYVMCHEIGHGFGLPHRDENTNNPDLGTCLDYTRNPGNNMSPDETDFSNLIDLYGEFSTRRARRISSTNNSNDVSHFNKINTSRDYKEGLLLYQSEKKEIYELNLGGNIKVVTTVLLAK